ncbi:MULTISPECIES: ArsR/SmtB family transcription factor [unclassified Nonomuraea]|uniref:ArsR/SmtB family transcription factor n=1 Tax=Nonomuraea sp. NPDC003804 TaxID=3154547 RepID=UPI0033B29F8A
MRLLPQPAIEDIQLTEVLHALADPARLEVVVKLATEVELTCRGVGEAIGLHKSTLSHHYRVLRDAGVVSTRQEGRQKFMTLRKGDLDDRFPGLLDSVIGAAG